jgi:hypothetical protein
MKFFDPILNHLFLLTAGFLISAVIWSSSNSGAQEVNPDCFKYSTYYRQVFINGSAEPLGLSFENVGPILDVLLSCTDNALNAEQRINAIALRGRFIRNAVTPRDKAEVKLLDFLAARDLADQAVSVEILALGALIEQRLFQGNFGTVKSRRDPSRALRQVSSREENRAAMKAYIHSCKVDDGIPIPENLGTPLLKDSPKAGWMGPEEISNDLDDPTTNLFILKNVPKNYLWIYKAFDSDGLLSGSCIAMHRDTSSAKDFASSPTDFQASFVGTICTNAKQTKACFFDNLTYNEKNGIQELTIEETLKTPYAELIQPNDISNYCTKCHIGENPFLTKPAGTIGRKVANELGYSPEAGDAGELFKLGGTDITSSGGVIWRNGDDFKPKFDGQGACESCHSLAEPLTMKKGNPETQSSLKDYCTHVLEASIIHTMPPNENSGGIVEKDYSLSVLALRALCASNP